MPTCSAQRKVPTSSQFRRLYLQPYDAYRPPVGCCLLAIPRSSDVELSGVATLYADRALPSKTPESQEV